MRRATSIAAGTGALALVAAACYAQVSYPPVDPTAFDTPAQRDAAISAATPPDCTAPLSDAYVASAGSQPRCMPRPDAVRATVVQVRNVVTAADGTFSGTWPAAFSAIPTGSMATVRSTSTPYICQVLPSTDTTTFSGKCWQLVPTQLPATVTSIIGLVVSPFANAAGGQPVTVYGRL